MRVNMSDHIKCTGCGLCKEICPVQAIEMKEDEYGFRYACTNSSKCIDCGKCEKVCEKIKAGLKTPLLCYAAARASEEKRMISSSGGMFAALAETILAKGGVVCGCELNPDMVAKHICIKEKKDLIRLLGSKYVQSDLQDVFKELRHHMNAGRQVLFCGTPCQVAAVKEYLADGDHLITVELICHGVPSNRMFRDYIHLTMEKNGSGEPAAFVFRDKRQGWSYNGRLTYKDPAGKTKDLKLPHRLSSYMTYFLDCDTYRDSCYSCPYAGEKRGADITIGDYWGVLKQCPEITQKIDISKGVSCCIVNTEKGKKMFESTEDLIWIKTDYKRVRAGNEPLNEPSKQSGKREQILDLYKQNGWDAVEQEFAKHGRIKRFVFRLYNMMPVGVQQMIRNVRDR